MDTESGSAVAKDGEKGVGGAGNGDAASLEDDENVLFHNSVKKIPTTERHTFSG